MLKKRQKGTKEGGERKWSGKKMIKELRKSYEKGRNIRKKKGNK